MRLKVTSLDTGPEGLYAQTPFEAELLRQIPGPDRPDYWLARLPNPIEWETEGRQLKISHLVLAARWSGSQIGAGMRDFPLGIAYVVDPSLLDDDALDFEKCQYVAIGFADEVADNAS